MSEIPHTNITRMVVKNYRSLVDVDIALSPLTVFPQGASQCWKKWGRQK